MLKKKKRRRRKNTSGKIFPKKAKCA